VVALSANGAHALPLLGGHNGANRLARACANALGGIAAITTASDNEFGLALDEPPAGWTVANIAAAKGVAAAMLSGEKINISVEAGSADWLLKSNAPFNAIPEIKSDGVDGVLVTANEIENPNKTLVLHPPVLALGVGCERGCDVDELYSLAMETLEKNNLSTDSVASVCSIDLKSDEVAVLELAKRLDVPPRFFNAAELELQSSRLANPSDVVFAEVGCHGVSEGAALAAVGDNGKLIVEKQKSSRATVAVGISPKDIVPENIGRGQGRLYIVGTGPGRDGWRTPDATRILSMVTDVVGYELYLDIVADLIVGKTRHTSQLAEEEARVRMSLELAAGGRDVALVSSGDPGIYAMAALAFELLDREDKPEWNRLHIEVAPGISAFQAAASKIGAPMGHDFCLISLSDLLTPWEIIEQRLIAAARGGFAVAFYNPVSKR
ncbi:MAG: cobalamin biosynthesis protein, partial [Rhodospirillaceae bacterium]|nr:cobalamin biosynthesis protein [Rhodospirillaceae bacterium]